MLLSRTRIIVGATSTLGGVGCIMRGGDRSRELFFWGRGLGFVERG